MHVLVASGTFFALLSATSLPDQPPLLNDGNVSFVGRVQRNADGSTSFDMNGVEVKTTVTGTTTLFASMSQVQMVKGNTFQVFLDDKLQPASRFNTSGKM